MTTGLEEQRDFLLRSLDDLEAEREAGTIDEADYATLKDDYTARAAAVLRALDAEASRPGEPSPEPRRSNRAAAAVAVIVALAVGAGVVAARSSDERGAGQFGTGGTREAAASEEPAGDGGNRLAEVQELERRGELLLAVQKLEEILEDDPDDVEALAYRGWIRVNLAAQVEGEDRKLLQARGEADIDAAIRLDPGYPFAHFFKGFVLRAEGDAEGAAREWELFLDTGAPTEMRPVVRQLIDDLEQGG